MMELDVRVDSFSIISRINPLEVESKIESVKQGFANPHEP